MRTPLVTVAIVPRERFSYANTSLDNVLATTTSDCDLVYIDGNSPPEVRDYVACQAEANAFRVVRREEYLSPNQARNLAVQHARTKYIVFVDNDVLVSPGWLEALVQCAEQTGAWVVGPIYCEGLPAATRIHMAGGDARLSETDGRRVLHESHRHFGKPLAEVRPQLKREPTEQIEFHCALVRREVFDRLGPLDEQLWSAAEHTDLCLAVREAGGEVFLEPDSVVTYVPPPPLARSDREYFALRWSDAWNVASVEHFRAKWNLTGDDPSLAFLSGWLAKHRQLAWHRVNAAARLLGGTPARWLQNHAIAPLERYLNRRRFPHVMTHRSRAAASALRADQSSESYASRVVAQTNLQLYNQMIASGRLPEDLRHARDAYELALRAFAGQFRANGKPFVAHLVGVAGILAAHEQPTEVVLAGLLHSVYTLGEFGDGSRGVYPGKQEQVRRAIGEVGESIVHAYTETRWGVADLKKLEARAARLTPVEHQVLRIKLADALEDHVDNGMTYAPRKRLVDETTNEEWVECLVRAGHAAGHVPLADELAAAASRTGVAVPGCLISMQPKTFNVVPLSHRARIAALVGRRFTRANYLHRKSA